METDRPAKKMFTPLQTLAATILIFFGAQFIVAALFFAVMQSAGWDTRGAQEWLRENPLRRFLFLAVIEALMLTAVWQLLKQRGLGFAAIGFNKPKLPHIGYTVAGFMVYLGMYVVTILIIKAYIPSLNLEQEQQVGFDLATRGPGLVPIFTSLVILPPLYEEIMARGFLYTGLRTRLTFLGAALITSTLFAAAHLGAANDGLLWVAGIDTFILSLVLCYVREKSKSLWPAIGIHFLKNGMVFLFLINIGQYLR